MHHGTKHFTKMSILVNFIFSKNEDFSILIIEVLCGKFPLRVKKTVRFQNKKANNLETL